MIKWFLACVGLLLACASSPPATSQTPPPAVRIRPENAPTLPPRARLTLAPIEQHLHWTPTDVPTRIEWEIDRQGAIDDAVLMHRVTHGNVEVTMWALGAAQIRVPLLGVITAENAHTDCMARAVPDPDGLNWTLMPGQPRSFCMLTDRGRLAYIVFTPHICDGVARFDVDVTMWPDI